MMTGEQNIKVTFPPLADGQDTWTTHLAAGTWNSPPEVKDARTTYQRLMYRALIWLHDRAELVWSWAWARSREYAPPSAFSRSAGICRDARSAATLQSSHDAGMYWAQRATTSITWNAILWHVRQRVTKKRREFDPLTKFVDKPTEEEALEVLREMWRNPPVFAPPEEARALAERIATLHTEQSRMKPQGVSR